MTAGVLLLLLASTLELHQTSFDIPADCSGDTYMGVVEDYARTYGRVSCGEFRFQVSEGSGGDPCRDVQVTDTPERNVVRLATEGGVSMSLCSWLSGESGAGSNGVLVSIGPGEASVSGRPKSAAETLRLLEVASSFRRGGSLTRGRAPSPVPQGEGKHR
jgi:hypothetical protein